MNTAQRRTRGLYVIVLAFVLSMMTMPAALAAPPAPNPDNPGVETDVTGCIPTNNLILDQIRDPMVDAIGAVGALMVPVALALVVLFGVLLMLSAARKKGAEWMTRLAMIIAIVVGLPIVLGLVWVAIQWGSALICPEGMWTW